jgi:hypothetical protein
VAFARLPRKTLRIHQVRKVGLTSHFAVPEFPQQCISGASQILAPMVSEYCFSPPSRNRQSKRSTTHPDDDERVVAGQTVAVRLIQKSSRHRHYLHWSPCMYFKSLPLHALLSEFRVAQNSVAPRPGRKSCDPSRNRECHVESRLLYAA